MNSLAPYYSLLTTLYLSNRRERHNKAVQRIVDTLLVRKPLISARAVVEMYLLPRKTVEVEVAAKKLADDPKGGTRKQRKALKAQQLEVGGWVGEGEPVEGL